MEIAIKRLSNENRQDFYHVHSDEVCGGWCFCASWWVADWESSAGDRTSDENRAFREHLFEKQIYDGYLVYIDGAPNGWCQVSPRDQFTRLIKRFELEPDPEIWAITCWALPPHLQGMGLTHRILPLILEDLRSRGVKLVQAYPKLAVNLPKEEIWTGPRSLYEKAGFKVVKADEKRPVLELTL